MHGLSLLTRHALRSQGLRLPAMVLLAAAVGVLEGAGVTLLLPLLQSIETGSLSGGGVLQDLTLWLFTALGVRPTVEAMLLLIVAVVAAQAVLAWTYNRVMYRSVVGFEASLRTTLLDTMLAARWRFFLTRKVGRSVTSLTTDAQQAGDAYFYLVQMLATGITIVVYAAVALAVSWEMTTLVVAGLGLVALALRPTIGRSAEFGARVTEANAEVQSDAYEELTGAKLLKSTASEAAASARFAAHVAELARWKYRAGMNAVLARTLFEPLSIALLCAGIYLAVVRLGVPLATVIVFLFMFYRLSPRVAGFQTNLHGILQYAPALERILSVADDARREAERSGGTPVGPLSDALRFEGVSFSYGDDVILSEVSAEVRAGEFVALVGPSGAGKSTLSDLALGLLEPDGGRITVDGADLATADVASWRSRVGYVTQDAVLFHATVRENLRLTNPSATDADLDEALRAAACDFVAQLPAGADTVVGDRGTRLSGGQRQRLALARALAHRPSMLVLDEATSALDAESEERIQRAIEGLAGKVTVLAITHRLATVRNADRVYYLEGGRVLESGTWTELYERGGRFRSMVDLQALESGGV